MIEKKVTKTKRVRKKLNQYERFEKDAPKIPGHTCPYIDEVLGHLIESNSILEDLRNMNSELRDSTEYWKNCCEEMQDTIDEMSELKEIIRNLVK